MLVLAFNVGLVRAQSETVYINADGSITPAGAPIVTYDNVTYTLTGNISYPAYDGIVVERNNTVIDGNGYTVQGNNNVPVYYRSGTGLRLTNIDNVTIKNANIENFQYGIYLSDSNNNVIDGNVATANSYGGIILDSSSNNIVIGNTVTANSLVGIELDYSSNSLITGNNATANNYCGIDIEYYSNNNTVSGNNASANHYSGFNLFSSASNNTVNDNNATANNWFGIYLYDSLNNSIYHNDFMNNKLSQAASINSTNTWDDGYPYGGNYWGDYNGTDFFKGPYQNVTGSDGIGDTPYVIDTNNIDHYPLMKLPYTALHGVAVTNITVYAICNRPYVYQGMPTNITVTVLDNGDFPENVNVTLYYDITANQIVGTQNITILAGENETLLFVWNTAGVPCYINYTLTAVATIATGTNTLSDGNITVRIMGDINGTGTVDISDVSIAAQAFGSHPDMPNWNPAADINGDGVVDIMDIALIASNFGQHYP
jgi:parallel beta-helix repeat protein